MDQPLLTVIVTCYNVEKYLDKCILSISNQTYHNLEILLIDDGSPDRSGIICDEWKERDARVRVIHKQNEGLAFARKTGVENTTTEFVTFVDADDWIDPDMYKDMMSALLSTNSDIAQCGVYLVYEDGRQIPHYIDDNQKAPFEVANRIESVLLMLEDKKWRPWMWNKIFKKHLFENIKFYKGRGYAEDDVSLYLYHKTTQNVYLNGYYYYYLQRTGGICQTVNVKQELKNHLDFSAAFSERYFLVKQYPEYHSALKHSACYALRISIHLLRNIIVFPQYFEKEYFYEKAKEVCDISLSKNNKLQRSLKIDYNILKLFGPKIYKFFRIFYVKIVKLTNKLKITHKQTYTLLSDMWACLAAPTT